MIWPGNRELYYGYALNTQQFVGFVGIHKMTREQLETIRVALEPLLLSDEPIGENATALLAAALGATPADRIAAADVVIEAISTHRLDTSKLAQAIAAAMQQPAAVADRWADGLRNVAAVSPYHSHQLQVLLAARLGALGSARPKLPNTVDLLRTVAQTTSTPIADRDARRWLEEAPPGSKLGRAAAAALAVGNHGP